jgi:hypothetical protein
VESILKNKPNDIELGATYVIVNDFFRGRQGILHDIELSNRQDRDVWIKLSSGAIIKTLLCNIKRADSLSEKWDDKEIVDGANKLSAAVSKARADQAGDLLDAYSPHRKAEADELRAAHEDRVRGYKKDTARNIKKMEASTKVSDILDRMVESRNKKEKEEELSSIPFTEKYDMAKIGITAGVQGFNIFQLLSLLLAGGFAPILGITTFVALLALNYHALTNNLYRDTGEKRR